MKNASTHFEILNHTRKFGRIMLFTIAYVCLSVFVCSLGLDFFFAKFRKTFQIFELTSGRGKMHRRAWITFLGLGNNIQTESDFIMSFFGTEASPEEERQKIDASGSYIKQLMNHTKTYNLHQNHYPDTVTRSRNSMVVWHTDMECE